MHPFLRLVREIHRRSLWQVLAVYLAGSWVALQVVSQLTNTAGLPDWVPPFALVLLVVGFPVVMATAIVQEGGPGRADGADTPPVAGTPAESPAASAGADEAPPPDRVPIAAPEPSLFARHLTWKRAILGGGVAFAVLGVAVAGYFVMRAAGIGPVASLVAQGLMEEGDAIVLADFRNSTPDPLLASVVTEALRIDLSSSRALGLVEPTQVQGALVRMGRDPASPLTGELAREVAVRDGFKAVLEGEIGAAGAGFILSATLRSAEDGATLASFRRTARDANGVVEAIDRLSQDVREKAGESLRSIRAGGTLQQVTTPSLAALRKYTEAEVLSSQGRETEALPFLEEAVAFDPEFAMAWRKLAVILGNQGRDRARETEAVQNAYRLRDRLTPTERYLTEALYHWTVGSDREAAVRAYENVLRIQPDHPAALNNLGLHLAEAGRPSEAAEVLARAVALPEPVAVAYFNLAQARLMSGDHDGARATFELYRERFPDDPRQHGLATYIHALALDVPAAERAIADGLASPNVPSSRRPNLLRMEAGLDLLQGRVARARRELQRQADEEGLAHAPVPRAGLAWVDTWWFQDLDAVARNLDQGIDELADDDNPARWVYLEVAAHLHLAAGHRGPARAWLDRWEAASPPDRTPPAQEQMRGLLRLWADELETDPDGVVAAFRTRARAPDCGRCIDALLPSLLEQAGRPGEASDAWRALIERPVPNLELAVVQIPLALREIGRLSEEAGDRAGALEAYRRLLELWAAPGPEMEGFVADLRDRVQALEGAAADG